MTMRLGPPLLAALLAAACHAPPALVDPDATGAAGGAEAAAAAPARADEPADDESADDGPRVLTGNVAFTPDELDLVLTLSPLPPAPGDPTNAYDDDPDAAALGHAVFYDERFSGTGDVSCATCHVPGRGWSDGKQLAEANGRLERHTQSLWNVAYNRWFFWDGRADSLWSQALVPLEEPREHAGSRLQYAHLLASDPELSAAYERVFGALPDVSDGLRFPPEGRPVPDQPDHPHAVAWGGMTGEDREAVNRVFVNLGKALAAFERGIVSRRAPFDVWVEGLREGDVYKQRSLSESARRGLKLFIGEARCVLCHSGPNFTDLEFHDNRVPDLRGGDQPRDPGRFAGVDLVQADPFNGIGRFSDDPRGEARAKVAFLLRNGHNWSEFKTPSLRNVVATAPYMHQGQLATLSDVLLHYARLESATPTHHAAETILQPFDLDAQGMQDLVAFLESLTDLSIDPALTRPPARTGDAAEEAH